GAFLRRQSRRLQKTRFDIGCKASVSDAGKKISQISRFVRAMISYSTPLDAADYKLGAHGVTRPTTKLDASGAQSAPRCSCHGERSRSISGTDGTKDMN